MVTPYPNEDLFIPGHDAKTDTRVEEAWMKKEILHNA
jgi:hypothetical protein